MNPSTAPQTLPTARPADPGRSIRYGDAVAWTLVAAFTLSVAHTIYAWQAGLEDPDFTVDTPLTWVFYGVAFAVAGVARRTSALAQGVVLAYLSVVLVIAIFYYPTTFTGEKQTTFGWFENDVYVGLLVLAFALSLARLLRRPLVP